MKYVGNGRTISNAKPLACEVRLDRLIIGAKGRIPLVLPEIQGFRVVADFRPHHQGKIAAYGRVRKFRSLRGFSQIVLQYERLVPWVEPWRFTMIADDRLGLTPEEIEAVIVKCANHQEHAAVGLCFACYRQVERAINSDPEAKAEQAASRDSGILVKAQNKMVKALCSQWALIKVYEEFGVASELLEEDSTLIPTLTKLFAPLLDKISSTLRPQKLEDPNPGPPPQPHVQTVLGNHYRVPPFEGEKTVPETLHVIVRKSPEPKPKMIRVMVRKSPGEKFGK